ncbi:MAG: hypothetical protein ACE5LF_06935 [Alphaproteobacteria bacterium]
MQRLSIEIDHKSYIRELRERFRDVWSFGRNVLVGWRPVDDGITVLYAPIYALPDIARRHAALLERHRHIDSDEKLDELVAAGCECALIDTPFRVMISPQAIDAIDGALVEFSVTKSKCRAVALFDIVKFSMLSPFEQVTQLNSLAYSVNIALARCRDAGIAVDLAMTTTGDGFYVWNKDEGLEADVALYQLAMLALADNAVAQEKDTNYRAPALRTCIHFGSHYEYFQAAGLSNQVREFIVGDATIEAARMISAALPNQVLIGSYLRERADADGEFDVITGGEPLNTPTFIALAQRDVVRLKGVPLADSHIESAEGYLTGERLSDEEFTIRTYAIPDKHGINHKVFNAKFKLVTASGKSVYVGRTDGDLDGFTAKPLKGEDIYVRVV